MYKKANENDLDRIFEIYIKCKNDLENKGIFQWDESYPTRQFIKEAINQGNLYKIEEDNTLIGSFILNTNLDEYWTKIDWQSNNFLGLHLLAIKPEYQGKGLGKKALDFCESKAKKEGYKSLHLDVFSKNRAALNLYKSNGYKKVEKLHYEFKPTGNKKYYCFEKLFQV